MKSLLGGMASFRIATFLSVLIIPVVSFFRPIFGVGSSITLMFQAFVCARIGMDYCKTDRDKMIAGVMAAVLATQGTAWASAWALAVGFGLNIFLSNWDPRKKRRRMPSRIKVEQRNNKDIKNREKRNCAGWVSALPLFVMRFVVC